MRKGTRPGPGWAGDSKRLRPACHAEQDLPAKSAKRPSNRYGNYTTKTDIIVEVVGFVPVTVSTTRVLTIVVPRAAPKCSSPDLFSDISM